MPKGKCDRKGRSMVERLLLYIGRHDGVTRRDMNRYIWRMQARPGKEAKAVGYARQTWPARKGQPGRFRYHLVKWTIFGPIKRLKYREAWGTNLGRLHGLGWIVRGPDKKWRLAQGAIVKAPIYNRRPFEPPPPPSPRRSPEEMEEVYYERNPGLWDEL